MIHLLPIFGNKATEIVVYYLGPSVGDNKSKIDDPNIKMQTKNKIEFKLDRT